jgi:hypothetical protein
MYEDLKDFYEWLMGKQKEVFPGLSSPVLPDVGSVYAFNQAVGEETVEEGDSPVSPAPQENDEYETVFVVVDASGNKIAPMYGVTDADGQKQHVQVDAKWQVPNGSYLKLQDLPATKKPFILLASEIKAIGIPGYHGPDIGDKDLVNGRKLPANIGWYSRVQILYGENKDKSPRGIIFNDDDTWLAVKSVRKTELPEWWFD